MRTRRRPGFFEFEFEFCLGFIAGLVFSLNGCGPFLVWSLRVGWAYSIEKLKQKYQPKYRAGTNSDLPGNRPSLLGFPVTTNGFKDQTRNETKLGRFPGFELVSYPVFLASTLNWSGKTSSGQLLIELGPLLTPRIRVKNCLTFPL